MKWGTVLLCIGIALILQSHRCDAGSRVSKADPKILAEQTGAAHFEEHFEPIESSEESGEHRLRKRSSDEDFDYEVYQGVVGRPGIDFPIHARIPQTSFSCRQYGNGYFADLETDCQVFHICDDGRKISFLCPNGTIFQQPELICDWWFKVNCGKSPGFYADSSEILSRGQSRRKSSKRVENDFGSGSKKSSYRSSSKSNGNKSQYPYKSSRRYEESDRLNQARLSSERRADSEENVSVETVDFEDITEGTRTYHRKSDKFQASSPNENEHESQVVAETASFVGNNGRNNGYNYDTPILGKKSPTERDYPRDVVTQRPKNDRGRQKFNDFRSNVYKNQNLPRATQDEQVEASTLEPQLFNNNANDANKLNLLNRSPNRFSTPRPSGYTTARRFDITKTTPFYTPTVPTVGGRFGEYKSTPASPPVKNAFNNILSTPIPFTQRKGSAQLVQNNRFNQATQAEQNNRFNLGTQTEQINRFSQGSQTDQINRFNQASQTEQISRFNQGSQTEQSNRFIQGSQTEQNRFNQRTQTDYVYAKPASFRAAPTTPAAPTRTTYFVSDGRRPAIDIRLINGTVTSTPGYSTNSNYDFSPFSTTIVPNLAAFSQTKLSSPAPFSVFTSGENTSSSADVFIPRQFESRRQNVQNRFDSTTLAPPQHKTENIEILNNPQLGFGARTTTDLPVEVITNNGFISSANQDSGKLVSTAGYEYQNPSTLRPASNTFGYSTVSNEYTTTLSPQENQSPPAPEVEDISGDLNEIKRNILNLAKQNSIQTTTSIPQGSTGYSTQGSVTSTYSPPVSTYTPQQPGQQSSTILPAQSTTVIPEEPVPTTYRPSITTVQPSSIAEHVKDMIKTLQDLKVPLKVGSRDGLDIPSSSGPEALHSLAEYFASEESTSTTESSAVTDENSSADQEGEEVAAKSDLNGSNLTKKTVYKYKNLFGLSTTTNAPEPTLGPDFKPNVAADGTDLEGQHSSNLLGDNIGKPETRKIAQVFTNALSAYLQDPESFRKVLTEVRPTEPPTLASGEFEQGTAASYLPAGPTTTAAPPAQTTTVRSTEGLEVLDYSDVTVSPGSESDSSTFKTKLNENQLSTTEESNYGSLATVTAIPNYVDKVPASKLITESLKKQSLRTETHQNIQVEEEPINVAQEINTGLGLSTVEPYLSLAESIAARKSSLDVFSSNTARPTTSYAYDNSGEISTTEASPVHVSFELLPPASDGETQTDDDEDTLQRAQSQSFATARNSFNRLQAKQGKRFESLKISTTETPRNDIQQSGHFITRLAYENPSTTEVPDYRKGTVTPWPATTSYTSYVDPLTINDAFANRSETVTTTPSPHTYLPRSTTLQPTTINVEVEDFGQSGASAMRVLLHPDIPEDALPPANGIQRIANKMFGNLDVQSANHLMNVMKKAESNETVRKLILLLIQTCDDNYGRTVEQSRKILLNALIGMDQKLSGNEEVQVFKLQPEREGRDIDLSNRSDKLIASTVESSASTTPYPFVSTVSNYEYSSTTQASSGEETTKYQTHSGESNEDSYGGISSTFKPIEGEYSTIPSTQEPTVYSTPDSFSSVQDSEQSLSSRRRTKDVNDSLGQPGYVSDLSHKNSDERALELLKSLYSLASKFSRR